MAWRVWSKLCCGQRWILLLSPLFLLFLTISVMTITLPLPLPPADIDRRSSRALSSAGGFKSRPRVAEPPPAAAAFQQPLAHTHSGARGPGAGKETSKRSVPPKPFGDAAGYDKNNIRERSHADSRRNKHKGRSIASKRKEMAGASHHHVPQFTVNNTLPQRRIRPRNHSAAVTHSPQTYIHPERSKSTAARLPATAQTIISERGAADRQTGRGGDRHTHRNADAQIHDIHKPAEPHQTVEKHREAIKPSRKSEEQQAVETLRKHHHVSEEGKNHPRSPGHGQARSRPARREDGGRCRSFREQDFPDGDHRKIRVSPELQPPPWLSRDDIQKMELLAGGEVVSKARVPAHGQVLQVALDPPAPPQKLVRDSHHHGAGRPSNHSERCRRGRCSLIKRTDDWFEVFAFHLDRVLGLNRSLPAVLRTFHSDVLPYRYTSGAPRPAVWWDPGIQHLADQDNDQNSVPLSWVQYQELLRARCGSRTDLRSAPCVGVRHSEWGRLALFDFLLQVNDRLDRYCCGFTPDPTELCVENLLHARCGNTKDLLLVHILVRKADPSRLVFIDNAGRPQQSTDNLNFRLVEGVDEFPERAVSVLRSGCLESLLLRSLYTDREFWESRGGAGGLGPLVRTVQQRANILLQHISDKKLRLKRDL